MKINLLFISFIVMTVTISCSKNKKEIEVKEAIEAHPDKYTILGHLKNIEDSTKIYINDGGVYVDSAYTVNGSFSFIFDKAVEPKEVVVMAQNFRKNGMLFLWLENHNIDITTATSNLKDATIDGGKTQKESDVLKKRNDSLEIEYKNVSDLLREPDTTKMADEERSNLSKKQHEVIAAINNNNLEFIKEFPDSFKSVVLLKTLNTTWDKKTVTKLYNDLSEKIKNSKNGKEIQQFISLPDTPVIGEYYIDFELPNTIGELVKLSDIKAKYTLIEFWASWCTPCIEENPKLVKTYNQYKSQGFEIIGVSLDITKTNWLKAIEKDKLPWVNVSDLKGNKTEVAQIYGINEIPNSVLINQEGIIIAKKLKGKQLEHKLKELFK